MAYPTDLDNFTPKSDNTDDVMATDVNELQTAIEAIEGKVGVDTSADTGSLDYKVAQNTAKVSFSGANINSATEKTTPVNADMVGLMDSAASNVLKKLSWSNIKATLKTYFDSLYAAALGADDNYVTDAEKIKLANLSGTNTGDQTLPTRDSLGLDTDDSPQFAGVNLGHASDTTLARSAAGIMTIEGLVACRRREIAASNQSAPAPSGNAEFNQYILTGQAQTGTFAAPSGTAINGNRLTIRVKDNGTARTLAWNAIYRAMGVAMPTTTVANKTTYIGFIYNSTDTKWDCVAVAQEA